MAEISDNIAQLRRDRGLSRAALGELIGTSADKVKHVETGHQRADHEFLFALGGALGVDLNELLGLPHAGKILPTPTDFVSIPRLDVEASAGHGAEGTAEDITGHYAFNRKWLARRGLTPNNLSVITVHGDSMEPEIYGGDLILIDCAQTDPVDSQIFATRFSGDLFVKRIQRLPGDRLQLISANAVYPPLIVTPSEASDVEIVGRVVASMHEW